jgi:CubicO group peptidase (beta-lactamase class C family)
MFRRFLSALLFILPVAMASAQQDDPLARSIPEDEGVSSAGISRFLLDAGHSKNEFHSFMFLRHGKVIAEGWWNPYGPGLKHTLYSVSKSFTSTAVGFAVSEGRLSVDDKIVSFFPDKLPDSVSPYLAAITVRDMLNMLEGQDPDPSGIVAASDSDWVKKFMTIPIVHQPGTSFLYNTIGVYVLSAIVQKVTGQTLIDYLEPRLFKPLGIRGEDWEISPQGIDVGGWGLRLKTEDLAKVGELYLQKGQWKGRQLLPAKWVTDAVTSRNDEGPAWAQHLPRDSSDWRQGYGYLFWRCRHGAFRADGAFGQYIIVMPDQDAVIAITSETADMQDELNLVWNDLLPAIHTGPLPVDKAAYAALRRQLSTLSLPKPPATSDAPLAAHLSGSTFHLAPNAARLKDLTISFAGDTCSVTLTTDTAAYRFGFGHSEWRMGTTARPGPNLATGRIPGRPIFRVAGSYSWKDENTLELTLRYIESPHTRTILCHFNGDDLTAYLRNSFEKEDKQLIINGKR